MAKSKAVKKAKSVTKAESASAPVPEAAKKEPTPVQEALQITWLLNGHIKRAQMAYILVGVELAEVRDRKLYAELHHPDMEDYAKQRLRLGRASLYSYLEIHDWIAALHKEWLEPNPKGFIPDLARAADLMQIEKELAKENLDEKKRAELDEMRQQGLDGRLEKGAFARWRKQGRGPAAESLKSYLTALRRIRTRGRKLSKLPPEVISHLDEAIEIIENHQTLLLAGVNFLDFGDFGIMGKFSSVVSVV